VGNYVGNGAIKRHRLSNRDDQTRIMVKSGVIAHTDAAEFTSHRDSPLAPPVAHQAGPKVPEILQTHGGATDTDHQERLGRHGVGPLRWPMHERAGRVEVHARLTPGQAAISQRECLVVERMERMDHTNGVCLTVRISRSR
jgi:hypothetical protein